MGLHIAHGEPKDTRGITNIGPSQYMTLKIDRQCTVNTTIEINIGIKKLTKTADLT